jgi:flagellar biosynthesis protein FlhG
MDDQAHALRKMMWEKKRKATYITVSSGKGGVGKSNFVVNLAHILSHKRKKVLIFDADLSLAKIDILLNLNVKDTIREYLFGNMDAEKIIIRNVYGFDLLPASRGFSDLAKISNEDVNRIMDIFINIDVYYDYIIFDTGAGISDIIIKLARLADYFIVITQPEPAAITDAYALMKVASLQEGIDKAYLVLNRVKDKIGDERIYENLKRIINKFLNMELVYLGSIREDKMLVQAILSQRLAVAEYPKSHYSLDMINIAGKITGASTKPTRISFYNFFRKRVGI